MNGRMKQTVDIFQIPMMLSWKIYAALANCLIFISTIRVCERRSDIHVSFLRLMQPLWNSKMNLHSDPSLMGHIDMMLKSNILPLITCRETACQRYVNCVTFNIYRGSVHNHRILCNQHQLRQSKIAATQCTEPHIFMLWLLAFIFSVIPRRSGSSTLVSAGE